MAKYTVIDQAIRHNGTKYKVGDEIEFEGNPPKGIKHLLTPVKEQSSNAANTSKAGGKKGGGKKSETSEDTEKGDEKEVETPDTTENGDGKE